MRLVLHLRLRDVGVGPGCELNVIVSPCPESSGLDEKYSRWSSPLICCSITCVTVFSTVFADAPGQVALIWIDGGAIVGYCAIGSVKIDSMPASMTMIAMTMRT